ncbi:hypothetical protein [Gordonia sp. DT101]|uniref:hypothetical protein n=1 Tax=Gordonia sp. DT101 TaxID=3416545 RepID=UPI003CEC1DA5
MKRVIITLVVLLVSVGAYFGYTTYRKHHYHKQDAINSCLTSIRNDISIELKANDIGQQQIAVLTSSASFSDVDAHKTIVTEDGLGILQREHKSNTDVLAAWEIHGTVALPGSLPQYGSLGSTNEFGCSAIVFKDGSITTLSRSVQDANE